MAARYGLASAGTQLGCCEHQDCMLEETERAMASLPSAAVQAVRGASNARVASRRMVNYTFRATISFLISEIALAGFSPLGQVLAQFMMVWQR